MFYKERIIPILRHFDPETTHNMARFGLHIAEKLPWSIRITDPRLQSNLAGIKLDNPIGVGAGWDKVASAILGLYRLGFSTAEIGTVTPHPQPGNPRPRIWAPSDGTLINHLGFNSPGMMAVSKNINRYKNLPIPIGISIGKNADTSLRDTPNDYAIAALHLFKMAKYLAINISSPNTEGLRKNQDRVLLNDILQAVIGSVGIDIPLFVKVDPDIENSKISEMIQTAIDNKIAGMIATNTSNKSLLRKDYGHKWKYHKGGLSGDNSLYRHMSTARVRQIYKESGGKLTVIGSDGVKDWQSALEKICAGATMVQVFTALRSEGPLVANNINRGLAAYLAQEGIKNISELIGSDH